MHEIAGRAIPPNFGIEPYTDNCRSICARGEHVLIGVSPGNSYFSEGRLASLLLWSSELFQKVDVIVPDISVVHTYRALGDPPDRAWSKAQIQTRRIRRRVARSWEAIGVPGGDRPVLTLSQFTDHPTYRRVHQRLERVVEHDPMVRDLFLRASGQALAAHLKGVQPTEWQLTEGMRYLLAELPLCTHAPGILGEPSSVNIYHQVIPFIPLVFAPGELRAEPGQAFALVRPAPTGDRAARTEEPAPRGRTDAPAPRGQAGT
ncbi:MULTISPECIES: tRNA-dependent cyclodipeptide synthase [unclassified Streptomyces]|uniref:tRNA-dependent cyclodipeptide synthase n=1 Tax=unclassified Streptomyces TaxID=2593676 RepID=UPI00382A3AE7